MESDTPSTTPASTNRLSQVDGIDGNEAPEKEQPEIEETGELIEKLELSELDVVVGGWSEAACGTSTTKAGPKARLSFSLAWGAPRA